MPKSFIAVLALIACSTASTAFAQSSDYSDGAAGGEAPTLVMPGLVTSPITSGLDSDGYGATATPSDTWTNDAPPEVPYSVEGEEQLEAETN
jgi:uncharacterized lipoprotein